MNIYITEWCACSEHMHVPWHARREPSPVHHPPNGNLAPVWEWDASPRRANRKADFKRTAKCEHSGSAERRTPLDLAIEISLYLLDVFIKCVFSVCLFRVCNVSLHLLLELCQTPKRWPMAPQRWPMAGAWHWHRKQCKTRDLVTYCPSLREGWTVEPNANCVLYTTQDVRKH